MSNHNIKVAGKSGCPIAIKFLNNEYIIVKKAKDAAYSNRLLLQANKQIEFYNTTIKGCAFLTPEITQINSTDEISEIVMKFVNAESYSTFLQKQHKTNLDNFIENLITYFTRNIASSNFNNSETIKPIIQKKVTELNIALTMIPQIEETFQKQIVDYLTNKVPATSIPIGHCHGDFTLSNMLFANNNKTYLIDFLDSFIESPLIDYVKLRQDTKYYWSAYIEHGDLSYNVRLIQTLNYIDNKIYTVLNTKYPFINEWEEYLTVMNFTRILPYANTESDINYLTQNLKKLLNTI